MCDRTLYYEFTISLKKIFMPMSIIMFENYDYVDLCAAQNTRGPLVGISYDFYFCRKFLR